MGFELRLDMFLAILGLPASSGRITGCDKAGSERAFYVNID